MRSRVASLCGLLLLAGWPLAFGSAYDLRLFALAGINAINVLGYQFVFGHAGALALTQGTFFGIGAYISALAALDLGWSGTITLPLAILGPVVLAALIAAPVLRLGSHYFALATLGIAQVVLLVAIQWESLTGGSNGRPGVPGLTLFGEVIPRGWPLVLLVWSLVGICAFVAWRHVRGARGPAYAIMRTDELAALASGIDIGRMRLIAFLWSAAFAGLSGALHVHTVRVISPEVLEFHVMVAVLTMTVVGGRLHIAGAIAGAFLLTHLPEWFRGFDRYYLIVYGLALLAAITLAPDGLWGWITRRRARAAVPPAVPEDTGTSTPAFATADPVMSSGSVEDASVQAPVGTATAAEASVVANVSASRSPILVIRDLHIAFGGVRALDGVSLAVGAGEIFGIIGPNGSGKTTLVNCVSRLYRADDGTVMLGDRDISTLAPFAVARAGLARTFQSLHLVDAISVADNVAVSRAWRTSTDVAHRRVGERGGGLSSASVRPFLERMGLTHLAEARVGDLPFGTRRMIEIARALALEPEVLMLDEPTAGLNAAEQRALAGRLRIIADQGVTVVLIEHNMPFLMPLAGRIACLDQGRVLAVGTPDAIRADPAVMRAYLGTPVSAA